MTGLIILAFVLYHLAHFTFGLTDPGHFHGQELVFDVGGTVPDIPGSTAPLVHFRHDVYAMVVAGFQSPIVVLLYVIAQAREDDAITFPVEGFDGGSISMLTIQIG
jgi:succinate dehydrogenase / fumarate reductase cytochrome b subunit